MVRRRRHRHERSHGGRAVVELLKAEQVRYIFGIVGATFLDVLDALYDDKAVEYINCRHEQGSAFMADGLARVTGTPGVCLVTSGPGATNLLTGVAAAHVAHSPVVVLVGGISSEHSDKDAFQEFDLVSMFRPVTKMAVKVTRADRIPEMLHAALRLAMTGAAGPVFLEIPATCSTTACRRRRRQSRAAIGPPMHRPPTPRPSAQAAHLVRHAERPLLLVGGGANWAGAADAVVRLCDQGAIPMITAYGRNDAVPNSHPLYIGPSGAPALPRPPPRAAGRICCSSSARASASSRPTSTIAISGRGSPSCRSTSTAAISGGTTPSRSA